MFTLCIEPNTLCRTTMWAYATQRSGECWKRKQQGWRERAWAFNVLRGKYDFNLTACVSDADSHVAFSLLFHCRFFFLLLFSRHSSYLVRVFFPRTLRRMATNINFISRWCSNGALLFQFQAEMFILGVGCVCVCMFFLLAIVYAACLSLLSLISLRNLRYFDFFLLVLHQFC